MTSFDQKQLPLDLYDSGLGYEGEFATLEFHEDANSSSTFDRVIHLSRAGSHLHGTATEHSDTDLKAIYLADIDDIIMGRDESTQKVSTHNDAVRNGRDDVEIELIELRKFMKDLMSGQTYAIELLFVNKENLIYASPIWNELAFSDTHKVSKNVKPFIGYCVAQARKYGLKGKRLAATEEVLEVLKTFHPKTRLYEVIDQIPLNEYCERFTKDLTSAKDNLPNLQEMIRINDKEFNLEVKVDYILPVIQKVVDRYGKRARKARDGVDWKAVSHAYRCIFELEELLTTGKITFPLRQRDFLLKVKKGEIPYEQIQNELPARIEEVKGLDSDLPQNPPEKFWKHWTLQQYRAIYGIE